MRPTELSKLSQKRDFKGHLLPFNLKIPVDAWKSTSRQAHRERVGVCQLCVRHRASHKYTGFG